MKKNKIIPLVLVVLISIIGYLIFENKTYQRQVSERDQVIEQLLIKDSITSTLISISENDSVFSYVVARDDDGNVLTYEQIDKLMRYYKNDARIKDAVILRAKQHYKFDYSIRNVGDSLTVISIWDKPKSR